jgi:hypothetical protein
VPVHAVKILLTKKTFALRVTSRHDLAFSSLNRGEAMPLKKNSPGFHPVKKNAFLFEMHLKMFY